MYRSMAYFTPKPHQLLAREQRWRKSAELLGLSSVAKQRLEWIIFYETVGQRNAAATVRYFGIVRSKFYFWLHRFDETNLRSLNDRSSMPHTTRSWNPDPIVLEQMIALRNEFKCKWGKRKLVPVYRDRYGQTISQWQFQKTIQEFHLYPPRKDTRYSKNGAKKERITKAIRQTAQNLFSLDTIVLHLFGTKRYLITAVEHTGKRGYARAYSTHSSAKAADFLARLKYLVGDDLGIILTDNGSEFQKDFDQACQDKHLTRFFSRVATPTDNPEVERFNRTLKHEWLSEGGWHQDLHEMNRSLTDWLIIYNNVRPHETLQDLTPLAYTAQTQGLSKTYPSCTTT